MDYVINKDYALDAGGAKHNYSRINTHDIVKWIRAEDAREFNNIKARYEDKQKFYAKEEIIEKLKSTTDNAELLKLVEELKMMI